jgi:cysteinyl-tRNA synthetase
VLFDLVREINRLKESDVAAAAALAGVLRELGEMLGILQNDPEVYLKGGSVITGSGNLAAQSAEVTGTGVAKYSDDYIEELIEKRTIAKKEKNWPEADRIRDELKSAGIILEDGPQGTTWRRG